MYQKVYVSKIEADRVFVGCSSTACEGCKSTLFCNNKKQEFEVKNPKALELSIGSYVKIFLPPQKTIFSTAMLFILPLVLLALVYVLLPLENQVTKALISLCGLALGFVIAYFYFRFKKTELMPLIESVEQDPIALEIQNRLKNLEEKER